MNKIQSDNFGLIWSCFAPMSRPSKRAESLGSTKYHSPHLRSALHGELESRISREFDVEIPDTEVVTAIAAFFNVRYDVSFGSPGTPGEPVLRRKNIARLTEAFIDHCRRLQLVAKHVS